MASAYSVACIQSVIRHVAGPDNAKEIIRENVNRIIANIEYTVRRAGRPRLVVLPEFALTGFDPERSIDDWVKICPQIPGEETAALGDVAAEHNLFICCGTMEFDPDWPGRWFNSAFIVGPDKSIVLRYRMHYAANVGGIGNCTSVGDVYTDYVKKYGQDSLFPVADTEIGKLAIVIGNDMAHPELVRAMVLKGAEVLCRPSSGFWGGLPEPTEALRRGRSFENQVIQAVASHGVYLSSLDDGRYVDDGYPLFSERQKCDVVPMARGAGRSGVWNFDARPMGMIDVHGEATVTCRIDLDDLRAARSNMSELAFPARLRTQLFPKVYEEAEAYPLDHWRETPIQTRQEGLDFSRQVVRQEQSGGLTLAPPEERLSFRAAVIQPVLHEIPDPEHRDEVVARNRDRLIELVESHVGEGTKLFQLPEFCMQGMPTRKTAPVWYDLCIEVPGPDTAPLQELAAKHSIYIAFGALEMDVERPRRWYNGNFLIAPNGEIVLKNRATHPTSARGTFGDYSDADHLGPDYDWRRLFPVADTPLGRIGLVIGHEILIPEVIRALVFNGAEIIGHAAGEPNMESTLGWTAVKRLRALENHAYVLTANSGGIRGSALGEARFPGLSAIIDYSGNTMVSIDTPGESSISVRLNMRGLRRRRAEPRSYLAQIKPGLYPEAYRSIAGFPIDLPEGESPAEVEPGKYLREVVRRLETTGTY